MAMQTETTTIRKMGSLLGASGIYRGCPSEFTLRDYLVI